MGDKKIKGARTARSVSPSFREAFRRAAMQTELHCAAEEERSALRELCYIIALVYATEANGRILIGGEVYRATLVAEIFEELTIEHLRLVRQNYLAQSVRIRNKRAYLRTALYNSVFELEAHYDNVASVATAGEKK